MCAGFKSVMSFDPKETDEQTANKFIDFIRDNYSAVGDKAVPNVKETQKWLKQHTG